MATKTAAHTAVEVTSLPKCDMCDKPAYADGKTQFGPWGNMCKTHFAMFGVGLGLGKGQRFVLKKEA